MEGITGAVVVLAVGMVRKDRKYFFEGASFFHKEVAVKEVAERVTSHKKVASEVAVTHRAQKKHLRFTVSACFYWSHLPESNWRPIDYESIALPTELRWPDNNLPMYCFYKIIWCFWSTNQVRKCL